MTVTAPVFLCPAVADAGVGDVVSMEGDEARHAVTVQRRAVGGSIDVVDGAGRRARGLIEHAEADALTLRVLVVGRDDDPEVTLVQALAKAGRDEQAVEAATQLGATGIVPWEADRSIVRWRGPKADRRRDAWAALTLAAAKQSRRARVPRVEPMVSTRTLAGQVREAVDGGARVLILHEIAAMPLTALTWNDRRQPVWVIAGPEGGISDAEVRMLAEAGGEMVRLGPHVLRSSTAGPAALAALAVARGTWADAARVGGLR